MKRRDIARTPELASAFQITEQPHALPDIIAAPDASPRSLYRALDEAVEQLESRAAAAEASLSTLRAECAAALARAEETREAQLRKANAAHEAARRKLLLGVIEDVMDNLDRSLAGLDGAADPAAERWIKRLQRTRRSLEQLLAAEQVVPIDFTNAPDGLVTTQEVIQRDDVPTGTIVGVIYRGYLWRGEILRKAVVIRAEA